jgi:hypothetical protein
MSAGGFHITRIELPENRNLTDLAKSVLESCKGNYEEYVADTIVARSGKTVVMAFAVGETEEDHRNFYNVCVALAIYADEVVTLVPARLYNRKVAVLNLQTPDEKEQMYFFILEKTPADRKGPKAWKEVDPETAKKMSLGIYKCAKLAKESQREIRNLFTEDLRGVSVREASLSREGDNKIFWTEGLMPPDTNMLEMVKTLAVDEFKRGGRVAPGAFARDNQKILAFKTELVDPDDKDAFAFKLVHLARISEELIVVNESWTLMEKIDSEENPERYEQLKQTLKDYRDGKIKSLEEVPGRTEVIHLVHSTPEREDNYFVPITRKEDGSGELGEWQKMPDPDSPVRGRFANFFKKTCPHYKEPDTNFFEEVEKAEKKHREEK